MKYERHYSVIAVQMHVLLVLSESSSYVLSIPRGPNNPCVFVFKFLTCPYHIVTVVWAGEFINGDLSFGSGQLV